MTDPGGFVTLSEHSFTADVPVEKCDGPDAMAKIDRLVTQLQRPNDNYKTWVLDTVSMLQYYVREDLSKKHRGQDLHGKVNDSILDLIAKLRKTPMNLIILSHVRFGKNESGEDVICYPDLSEGLRAKIAAMSDAVWFMNESIGGQRILQTQPGRNLVTSAGGRVEFPKEIKISKEKGFKDIEARLMNAPEFNNESESE